MTPRVEQELVLIRQYFPEAEYLESGSGWVRLPEFNFPADIWSKNIADVCFQIPNAYPGQAPYGFYVKEGLRPKGNNALPSNYTETSEPPFGGIWGKFSWQIDGKWEATADVQGGSNLISFIWSFKDRLKEAN